MRTDTDSAPGTYDSGVTQWRGTTHTSKRGKTGRVNVDGTCKHTLRVIFTHERYFIDSHVTSLASTYIRIANIFDGLT